MWTETWQCWQSNQPLQRGNTMYVAASAFWTLGARAAPVTALKAV